MISASGVAWSWEGSGDIEGCGVGSGGGSSAVADAQGVRMGALFCFLGDALLEGDACSGAALCSGSKSSEGSMFSPTIALRVRPEVRGVLGIEAAVFLLDWVCLLGLR